MAAHVRLLAARTPVKQRRLYTMRLQKDSVSILAFHVSNTEYGAARQQILGRRKLAVVALTSGGPAALVCSVKDLGHVLVCTAAHSYALLPPQT